MGEGPNFDLREITEINQLLCVRSLFLYCIKQIDSMLRCVCSVTDHRRRQNVVRTSPRVPLFCSYRILTSSVIYYSTDARQHGIYLLKRKLLQTPQHPPTPPPKKKNDEIGQMDNRNQAR